MPDAAGKAISLLYLPMYYLNQFFMMRSDKARYVPSEEKDE